MCIYTIYVYNHIINDMLYVYKWAAKQKHFLEVCDRRCEATQETLAMPEKIQEFSEAGPPPTIQ